MAEIPDGYEELSKADYDRIMEKLREKKATFKDCELCGINDWRFFPGVVSPKVLIRNVEKQTLKDWDGQSFNQVVFSCANCGNSKFFELHFLGLSLSTPAGKDND